MDNASHALLRLIGLKLVGAVLWMVFVSATFADPSLAGEVGEQAANDQAEQPVSFVNDVMPVLTKAGCNTGVCHAKAGGGQNGFQLSLLGFEPQDDYRRLVEKAAGGGSFPPLPSRA